MGYWDKPGASDEWYTPAYIFDAMGVRFDLDVAHPNGLTTHVPAGRFYWSAALDLEWSGFVWMNPPFGGRNGILPWLEKFMIHGDGVALTPDRTSAEWWQYAAKASDAVLFLSGKVKFERPDGSVGKSPSNGTTLFACGPRGVTALRNAHLAGLGYSAVSAYPAKQAKAA